MRNIFNCIYIFILLISAGFNAQTDIYDRITVRPGPQPNVTTDSSLPPPEFSLKGGFYSSEISLALTTVQQKGIIYYTVDGSEPNNNSVKYISQIPITNTTVIRAITIVSDSLRSKIETNTYFINESSKLPVISISTNPDNLWDNDYGIYVLGDSAESEVPYFGANFWQDWEKPIHIEFYEPTGELGFSIDAGVKIYGAWARANPEKSLAIYARDYYGYKKINYKIFPDLDITKFNNIVLRNSGNDWNTTMFRDAMMQTLVKNTEIDVLAYRPAVVYLNGEYWGIHNIREKINEHYIANHHPVNPDSVDILEFDGEIVHGDNNSYDALIQYILRHNLSYTENYQYLSSLMDIDEYISYMVAEIYFDNTDWPGNNIKFWRPQTSGGKWRWILFDTDFGFCMYNSNGFQDNALEAATTPNGVGWPNPPWSTLLLRQLLTNSEFKNKFINRFADFSNSVFVSDSVINTIRKIKRIIEPEMPKHFNKWQHKTISGWNNNIQILEDFARKRNSFMYSHFIQKFNLKGLGSVSLNVIPANAGRIKLNSLTLNKFPWKGNYFLGVPLMISVIPNAGYKFKNWEGIGGTDSSSISFPLPSDVSITAVFDTDSTNFNVVINEINYNSETNFDTEDWIELYNKCENPIDISNWVFKDGDDNHIFEIPAGTIINKDCYIVLCSDTSKFSLFYPLVKNRIGNFDFGLNSNGEKVRLFDKNRNIADSLTYDCNPPWPVDADGKGKTLSLENPNFDNSLPQSWLPSKSNGTPGKINDVFTYIKKNEVPAKSTNFILNQNFPNPFNPITKIEYSVPSNGTSQGVFVQLKIYDVLGNEVVTLVNGEKPAGTYEVEFNASGLAGGIYFYRLENPLGSKSKKMIFLK